jgi:ubiquinone/menaquinone biosynthesis C-methylase UbiE
VTTTDRQAAQYARFREWAEREGTMERPILLDTYMKPHQQRRIEWLTRNAKGRTAEVGCNWGYVLAAVGGHAGLDINPALIDIARVFAPDREFLVGDARALPWPDRWFDTVMLTEVLEHLDWQDVSKAVDEALRVASVQVLITLPDGCEDTADATNHKHRWLAEDARVDNLGRYIADRTGRLPFVTAHGGFWLIRAVK